MTNNNNNERENEMTMEFDDFDTMIQSDELEMVSDDDLRNAETFMDTLEDELNLELSAIEDELDYHSLDDMIDSESCHDEQRDYDYYAS